MIHGKYEREHVDDLIKKGHIFRFIEDTMDHMENVNVELLDVD